MRKLSSRLNQNHWLKSSKIKVPNFWSKKRRSKSQLYSMNNQQFNIKMLLLSTKYFLNRYKLSQRLYKPRKRKLFLSLRWLSKKLFFQDTKYSRKSVNLRRRWTGKERKLRESVQNKRKKKGSSSLEGNHNILQNRMPPKRKKKLKSKSQKKLKSRNQSLSSKNSQNQKSYPQKRQRTKLKLITLKTSASPAQLTTKQASNKALSQSQNKKTKTAANNAAQSCDTLIYSPLLVHSN